MKTKINSFGRLTEEDLILKELEQEEENNYLFERINKGETINAESYF